MSTIPSLALIPSGVKASKVYSVLPINGSGDFDFTRSGNATRVNSEGLIELVSSNVPRLNYPLIDGVVSGCPSLLLEPQSINQWHNSNDFTQSSWIHTNVTISSSSEISPDGTLNAYKITDNSTSGEHRIRGNTLFIPSGANISIFAKAAEYSKFAIANLSDLYLIKFDLSNGTIISTETGWSNAKIEDYGNGWFRLSGTVSENKTCGYGLLNDSGNFIFSGDGTKGVHIWGAQFEDSSSYVTSYIPTTTTSAVTRSAETCNNAGDASTFNDSEGVLFAEISALADDGTYRLISLSDNSANNFIVIGYKDTFNKTFFDGLIGGVRFITSEPTVNQEQLNKICLKYKSGSNSIYINGFKIDSNTNTFTPIGSQLNELKFSYYTNTLPFYGNTKKIQYFPTALNDSDLETLTSWDSFSDMATSQLYTIE